MLLVSRSNSMRLSVCLLFHEKRCVLKRRRERERMGEKRREEKRGRRERTCTMRVDLEQWMMNGWRFSSLRRCFAFLLWISDLFTRDENEDMHVKWTAFSIIITAGDREFSRSNLTMDTNVKDVQTQVCLCVRKHNRTFLNLPEESVPVSRLSCRCLCPSSWTVDCADENEVEQITSWIVSLSLSPSLMLLQFRPVQRFIAWTTSNWWKIITTAMPNDNRSMIRRRRREMIRKNNTNKTNQLSVRRFSSDSSGVGLLAYHIGSSKHRGVNECPLIHKLFDLLELEERRTTLIDRADQTTKRSKNEAEPNRLVSHSTRDD